MWSAELWIEPHCPPSANDGTAGSVGKQLPVERTDDSAALSLQCWPAGHYRCECGCEMFINCGFISYVSLLLFFTLFLKFILVFFQKVSQVL